MLPGVIRGEYAVADAHLALAPLAAAAGARLVVAEAVAIDLVAAPGPAGGGAGGALRPAVDRRGRHPGTAARADGADAIPVKPIGRFLDRLAALEARLPDGARLAVVGDGAGGTELALALARRLAGRARILLVGTAPEPLAEAPPRARRVVRAALDAAGVAVRSGVRAGRLDAGWLALSDGTAEPAAAALWATGVVGPAFLAASGLACDPAGCVRVAPTLQSLSHPMRVRRRRLCRDRRRAAAQGGRLGGARRPGAGGEPAPRGPRRGAASLAPAAPGAGDPRPRRRAGGGLARRMDACPAARSPGGRTGSTGAGWRATAESRPAPRGCEPGARGAVCAASAPPAPGRPVPIPCHEVPCAPTASPPSPPTVSAPKSSKPASRCSTRWPAATAASSSRSITTPGDRTGTAGTG